VAMLDIKGKEMYSTGCTESVTSRVWIDVKADLLPDPDTSFRNILSIQFTKFFSRDAVLDNAAFPYARYYSFRGKEARNEAKI
jgi:hypothetical protein